MREARKEQKVVGKQKGQQEGISGTEDQGANSPKTNMLESTTARQDKDGNYNSINFANNTITEGTTEDLNEGAENIKK